MATGRCEVTDALATTARLHPDLRWRHKGLTVVGTSRTRRVTLGGGVILIERNRADGWQATHHETNFGATLEALAAQAVDLRRAIGWPVGVAS